MYKNNKGFTLIELLAVITIMGVLLIVAIPAITKTIQNARIDTAINSVKTFVKEANKELLSELTAGNEVPDGKYRVMSDGNVCLDNSVTDPDDCGDSDIFIVEVDGQKVSGGKVEIRNNKVVEVFNMEIIKGYVNQYSETKYYFGYEKVLSADEVITISNATELVSFATDVNSGKTSTYFGKTVQLIADIDLNGISWTPISKLTIPFDGQGHKISNLKNSSIFNTISPTGEVKNLTLENPAASFSSNKGIGFIANSIEGKAENCTVNNASISNTGYLNSSGAMFSNAVNGAVINNCHVNGVTIKATSMTDAGHQVGGMIGYANGSSAHVTITNSSVSNVTIIGGKKTKRFGGLIGYTLFTTVDNCTVTNANISAADYYYNIAGFIGLTANNSFIQNSSVNGATINVTKVTTGGWVAGFSSRAYIWTDGTKVSFDNCKVSGLSLTLNAIDTSGAGGFTGAATDTTIKNCTVEGNIYTTADAIAGGAVNPLYGTGSPVTENNIVNVQINSK